MSNLIPIVSSSPPPMDDGGGFDGGWDDDDDFGTFTGANDSVLSTPGKPGDWSTPAGDPENDKFTFTSWSQSGTDSIQGNAHSAADSGISEFANFSAMGESTNVTEIEHSHLENGSKSSDIKLDVDTNDDEPIAHEQVDTKQSFTDSGLYSQEVSPLRHTEVTEVDNKSLSDSDSICEPQIDKISSEIKDEKDSANLEYISGDGRDDSTQNKQIPEETKDMHSDTNESKSLSNSKETNDSLKEKSVSNTSEDRLQSESIPKAQSSSHSIDDGENNRLSLSQPPVQADSEISATTTESTYIDTDKMTHDNEYQTGNAVKESISSGNEMASSGTDVEELEHDLTVNDKCDSEPIPNCESKTDSEDLIDSQPKGSLTVNVKDEEQELNSGRNETKNEELRTDNVGSCNIVEDSSEGSQKDSDLDICPEQINVSPDSGAESDLDLREENENSESQDSDHIANDNCDILESSQSDKNITKDKNEENQSEDFTDFNGASSGSENNFDDFSAFNSGAVDNTSKEEEMGKLGTFESESTRKEVPKHKKTIDANEEEKLNSDGDFDDFTAFTSENDIDDSKFSESPLQSHTATDVSASDFGNFAETGSGFAAFGSESAADNFESSETDDDWAAFSEPQISQPVAASDIDDEEWAAFGGDEETMTQKEEVTPVSVHSVQPSIQNLSKEEKVMYAVTGCFSSVIAVADGDVTQEHEDVLEIDTKSSDADLWGNMRGLKTTNALCYHWSQSQWNNHLYSTLHVDTRNILFGHKKSSSMPIFASSLTMLEPTKGPSGSNSRSQETLIDTSKPDESQVYTQVNTPPRIHKNDTIPPAQFDWSSSGLTNPLEAANKTLNLDFLIQEAENSSGKSHALESEFLTPDDASHKPAAIQPLENILANLKSSSTFKQTNQKEDLSQEASRIIQSLPNLSFMKTKVLMFPLKLND